MIDPRRLEQELAEATTLHHDVVAVEPGILRVTPRGFAPGSPAYQLRLEHAGLRYEINVGAAIYGGQLLTHLLDRLAEHPDDIEGLRSRLSDLGWALKSGPAAGQTDLLVAREGPAAAVLAREEREEYVSRAAADLSNFVLSSLNISHSLAGSRPARRRDESTGESVTWTYDPAERDRATANHRRLENWLLEKVLSEGLAPLDPEGTVEFDLAWLERDGSLSVCEVKTTSGHEDRQIRLGVGQVLHYQSHLASGWPAPVTPVLLVEQEPSDALWLDICGAHRIVLTWPDGWSTSRAGWPTYGQSQGREAVGRARAASDPEDPESE